MYFSSHRLTPSSDLPGNWNSTFRRGNLGVAVIQLVGLLALATAGHQAPYWVCAIYLVLLAIVGIAAALFMDNLDHRIEVNHMREILFDRDTWAISLLYVCTFGSWIGFSFAFGQVMQLN